MNKLTLVNYENGEIISCYSIEDQNAEIDMDYISPNTSGTKTIKRIKYILK